MSRRNRPPKTQEEIEAEDRLDGERLFAEQEAYEDSPERLRERLGALETAVKRILEYLARKEELKGVRP